MIDYSSPVPSTSAVAGPQLAVTEPVDVTGSKSAGVAADDAQEVSKMAMAEEPVCGSGPVSRGSSVSTLPWVCNRFFCTCLTVLDRMIRFMIYPLLLMIPG